MLSLYTILEVLITWYQHLCCFSQTLILSMCSCFFWRWKDKRMFMKTRGRLVIFWFGFREQRVTGTLVFILTGLSVFMAPILKVNMWNIHLFLLLRTLTYNWTCEEWNSLWDTCKILISSVTHWSRGQVERGL